MDEKAEEENDRVEEKEENSWWGSLPVWFQAAKEKSSTALEFMKRDLSELSLTVQTDAAAAISSTATLLKDTLTIEGAENVAHKAKDGLSSIIGTIADAFIPQKELEDSEMVMIRNSEVVTLQWWEAQLHLIRKDPKTYCHEPEGPPELYENWLAAFDITDYQEEMKDIMRNCSVVQALYEELVIPNAVSHLEFWQRYYYRVHLLRKAEARRSELLRRAEEVSLEDFEWKKGDNKSLVSQPGKSPDRTIYDTTNLEYQGTVSHESGAISKLGALHLTSKAVVDTTNENYNQVPQRKIPITDSKKASDACISDTCGDSDDSRNYKLSINNNGSVQQTVLTETSGQGITADAGIKTIDSDDCRSISPHSSESAGKDYSTGDEWEKDFDLDAPESDLTSVETIKPTTVTNEIKNSSNKNG